MDMGISGSRIPGILIVVLIVLASGISHGMASDVIVNSDKIGSTGSSQSDILGIWEQDSSPSLEDGDTVHALSGSQFLPPCTSENTKEIQIFAVITAGIKRTSPASVQAVIENAKGSFHQQVPMTSLSHTEGIFTTGHAGTANLISYTGAATSDEIISRLREDSAVVWNGEVTIPYGKNAGEYTVTVHDINLNDDNPVPYKNSFRYLPVACMEFDFSSINYGTSQIDRETWIRGDTTFGTSDKPSMRNTGNCPAQLKLIQDDMGFGKNSGSAWNIQYGIRVGDNASVSHYNPEKEIVLTDPIMPGAVEPLDFSVHVYQGSGNHLGTMTLGFDKAEITDPDNPLPKDMPVPEFPQFPDILKIIAGFVNMVDYTMVFST